MMHTVTLELPGEINEPLLHQAQRSASTPEALLTQRAVNAIQPVPEDPLLKLFGSIEADVSDVSARHDDYLGRSQQRGIASVFINDHHFEQVGLVRLLK